jgi:hypothetical protein
MMILLEASWQDQSGTAQKCSSRMENRSTGGACIRLRRPVHVGAKLNLRWRWEEFMGTAGYCRNDGRDYLVGIQKDAEPKAEHHEKPSSEEGFDDGEQHERPAK